MVARRLVGGMRGTRADHSADYLDVPVKFLGKISKEKTQLPESEYKLYAGRLMDKSVKHKTLRGNVPKELLITLSSSHGHLTAIPKNGGLALSVSLYNIKKVLENGEFVVSVCAPLLSALQQVRHHLGRRGQHDGALGVCVPV